jgi:hypothetical protein
VQQTDNSVGGSVSTPAQAALYWAQGAINQLIAMTSSYQRSQQTLPTPINPQ